MFRQATETPLAVSWTGYSSAVNLLKGRKEFTGAASILRNAAVIGKLAGVVTSFTANTTATYPFVEKRVASKETTQEDSNYVIHLK